MDAVIHSSAGQAGVAAIHSATGPIRWTVEGFLRSLDGEPAPLQPFAELSTTFCAALSRDLFDLPEVRDLPQVVALAHWLRPASVDLARQAFTAAQDAGSILVPRGRAFHVTPANVDTMFVYSWILSLLVGNSNVVRLSERFNAATSVLLHAIGRRLEDRAFAAISARNHLVFCGHDEECSRSLSAISDVRVLWGGDATIDHFRAFPLPPRGKDITFPDRHSFAIISANAVSDASDADIESLAAGLFNDAYWFDQAACSSPRLVIWEAGDRQVAQVARQRLRKALSETIRRRRFEVEAGTAIEKMVFGLRAAAEGRAVSYDAPSNEVTWVELADLAGYNREHCGGGFFFEYVSADLTADLARLVNRRDQTVACYGVDAPTAIRLARGLNGQGVDRWVRIGRALQFSAVWDGCDLLREFSRRVVVDLQN